MKKKFLWIILSCLMVLSLVLASCATAEEEEEEEEEGPPVSGDWWDKWGEPKYGGTITVRAESNFDQFDSFIQRADTLEGLWLSPLMYHDWTLDRKIWPFNITWCPDEYLAGCLAESWEIIDYTKVIFDIRKGIHWQDKPPVNGREFTANDVEYHFHRAFGLGSGFTEPQCQSVGAYWSRLESVTATDKYTVVFEYSEPALENSQGPGMFGYLASNRPVPREVIETYGDTTDWRNAVGTGAWILEDFVSGSSATLVKNPDYFRYDERHPENRLPYADELSILIIPDLMTAISGLRTGKIDIVENIPWDTAKVLKESNPELRQATRPIGINALYMRLDNEPFTDIKVRKALQMAIDIPTIAETYYGGLFDPTIYGKGGPAHVAGGWTLPFDQWPQATKEAYAYNPEGARALLEEAGYPNGFSTNVEMPTSLDVDLMQIVKSYFNDINVDMEIKVYEDTAAGARMSNYESDQMYFPRGFTPAGGARDPNSLANEYHSTWFLNWTNNNDPVYDAMVDELKASLDDAERKRLFKEIDDYNTSRFWWIAISPLVSNTVGYQPWLKGFMGEAFPRLTWVGYYLEGFWIDKD